MYSNFVLPWSRDSGNDFGRFSVPFPEGRISDIRVACNYLGSCAFSFNFYAFMSVVAVRAHIRPIIPTSCY